MSEYIDPDTIGETRLARGVKTGWHVQGVLVEQVFVGPDYVLIDVRHSDGHAEPLMFRFGEFVSTRTPAEQVAYVEARHRQLVAQASLERAVLSARPAPPCERRECAATRVELGDLRRRRAASLRTAPVLTGAAR